MSERIPEFVVYEVGKKVYPVTRKDKITLQSDDSGFLLTVALNGVSSKEKRAYKSGVPQFKLALVNGIMFFISRFDTEPWMDAPYIRAMSGPFTLIRPCDGQGYALAVALVDSSTGILLSYRVIGLSTAFSNAMFDAITALEDVPESDLHFRLVSVYHQYRTTDLVDIAVASN